MSTDTPEKPLGHKNYGSIGHLPSSNLGPGDHTINDGMASICKTGRNKGGHPYRVIVEEKYDGANVGIAKVDGEIVALGRAGYPAETSPYEQHHWFAQWVDERRGMFDRALDEGDRLAGEWLAVAHGVKYDLGDGALEHPPFIAFDLMRDGHERAPRDAFDDWIAHAPVSRVRRVFDERGEGVDPEAAMEQLTDDPDELRPVADPAPEGLVYRVERDGEVCFLAKWTRPDFEHGKYLPGIGRPEGAEPIINEGVDIGRWDDAA